VRVAGKILGWKRGKASVIDWLLQTKALIMIIFVNILLDKGILTSDTLAALLLMAIGSTMLSEPMVHPKLRQIATATSTPEAQRHPVLSAASDAFPAS
jgi:Kef-type K+ transport system membrane component KefB